MIERIRDTLLALTIIFAAAASLPTHGSAQVVVGNVIDALTQRPVLLAEVTLVDSTGTAFDQTFTNHEGGFQLVPGVPGSYYIAVESIGYQTGFDGVLDIGEGGVITVEFSLSPKPVELDGLSVEGRAARFEANLENQGFYERQQMGFGRFYSTADLEKSVSSQLSDILQRIPGVFSSRGLGSSTIHFRSYDIGADFCTPDLYIDGARVAGAGTAGGAPVDVMAIPADLIGMEVYTRAASVPIEYSGVGSTCGVILLWTKR